LYKEANPAVFTTVTFPYLFGIMFGDVFTGSLTVLMVLGVYFAGPNNPVYPMRHFLLLCGLFSVYCGFLYNDFTSLPMYAFGDSCYIYPTNSIEGVQKPGCVYPFGIDPSWYMSVDELTFVNSIKMKLSVILGVFHMCIGICMRGSNAIYDRKWVDFFFEFVPMLLMMLCLFGFMDLMIILKWLTDWSTMEKGSERAPSIISAMITMCIQVGVRTPGDMEYPVIGTVETQSMLMKTMMIIVVLCVPTMLLAKPIILGCC